MMASLVCWGVTVLWSWMVMEGDGPEESFDYLLTGSA